mmetsp:Transcript_19968/g.46016  ORF Transcript_19968/g.46016 Transcript_19968/m.46016 type:complete len:106 (+) Transcript_19968:84-401(+)
MAMLLRTAARVAGSRTVAPQAIRTSCAATQQQLVKASQSPMANLSTRSFGAVVQHKPETAVARPFKGASRSEPEMEYVEVPSMTYMTIMLMVPMAVAYWGLTKFI